MKMWRQDSSPLGDSMLISAVEVLWTARYDYKPCWKLVHHEHDFFQMMYFLAGSGQLFLGDREYPIEAGTLFLIKPYRKHGLAPASHVKTLDLKFQVTDQNLLQGLLEAADLLPEKDGSVATLFGRIREEGERMGYLYRESCNLLLLQILIHYLRQDRRCTEAEEARLAPEEVSGDDVVRRAVEFIKGHYSEDLDLPQIAIAAQRSDRHIRQHFEDCLKVSPMRYLLQYRVKKAKELIQDSDYALKEIAELVGFKTIHHFTRVFHEIAGESPAAWRRRFQEGICKDVCIHPHYSNVNWTMQDFGSQLNSQGPR
jgi:AraC-like DNA-binding protein